MNSFSASCCRFGYESVTSPYSLVYDRSTSVILEQRQVCWAKALLHKPVPPLAKTRWYLRLTVFALESHYQQVCSTQTGVPPEQCCCWFSCLLTSEWHSVNMSIYSNPAQGRSARFGSAWSGGEVELVILTNSGMEATQLLQRPRRRLAQKPCRMKVVNTPRHP